MSNDAGPAAKLRPSEAVISSGAARVPWRDRYKVKQAQQQAARNEVTEIIVILDRSGSMVKVKEDTEAAINAYVAKQRAEIGEARLTLVEFNEKANTVYESRALDLVPEFKLQPWGGTALYDAIGSTVTKAHHRFVAESDGVAAALPRVVVVILTDGLENMSTSWSTTTLKPLVERQTNQYGWTFLFLGANQNAIFEGAKIGVKSDTALTYDVRNMDATMEMASLATTEVRQRGRFAGYTQQQRETVAKPKEIES